MAPEPQITWSEPVKQLVSFAGSFLAAGAVGFRYTAARALRLAPGEKEFFESALRRAAILGIVGAVVGLAFALTALPGLAARAHRNVGELLTSDASALLSVVCPALTLAGVVLASASLRSGWPLAALGLVSTALAPTVAG